MTKTKWTLDPAHSSVDFSVKHMMIANVKGTFTKFAAVIDADPADLTTADISFTIDAASIDTKNADRDNHLKSQDFFDVDTHQEITFNATNIVKKDESEYDVTGDLTIRGVTKQETLAVEFEGTGLDPWGNTKAGFTVSGAISRNDYGLTWNSALETGGVLVGDKIKISLDIQASKG